MNVANRALYPKRAMLNGTPIAAQTLTVTGTAALPTGYTAFPAVGGVDLVTFVVDLGDVRCFWEGTTPTSTVGILLPAGTAYTWDTSIFNATKFILDTSASTATITSSPLSL
jgi:hypothetical protein